MVSPEQIDEYLLNKDLPTVMCVGDVMLDRFNYGNVKRISPEAPIPILKLTHQSKMLGGAGNVVRNLLSVAVPVEFMAVVGEDTAAREIAELLAEYSQLTPHLVHEADRMTTQKDRFVSHNQQLLRADREHDWPIAKATVDRLIEIAKAKINQVKGLILSDYGKGVLTDDFVKALIQIAGKRPIVIDPKGTDYSKYAGATVICPNEKELGESIGRELSGVDDIVAAANELQDNINVKAVLVTRGPQGMVLVEKGKDPVVIPTRARAVYDVSGAGDTVVALLTTGLVAGLKMPQAVELANIAAGLVVEKVGTATVSLNEIIDYLHGHDQRSDKFVEINDAMSQVDAWRSRGLKVGFTNGCFDILHPGHISLLDQARSKCDRLVVAINSDASVKRLKGESRPLQDSISRANILNSMHQVDLLLVFEEDTPLKLINQLRPDVLVKGADYTVDEVVGAKEVQSWGGEVVLAKLVEGKSTTKLVSKSNS